MKNLIIGIVLLFVGSAYVVAPVSSSKANGADKRLDYLIGDWKSNGFVTDAKNRQQKIEMEEQITAKDNEIRFTYNGLNPSNGYRYKTNKIFYLDASTHDWFVKGTVQGQYTLNDKVYVTDIGTITYTFYDHAKNLMRYTIMKENEDSFTETEEIWTKNGWDQSAWVRSLRVYKNKDYSHYFPRPSH